VCHGLKKDVSPLDDALDLEKDDRAVGYLSLGRSTSPKVKNGPLNEPLAHNDEKSAEDKKIA
ncbi:MAG TPA: hypothetical protein VMS31_21930, partial [Pyrinomonadaceae bacterium]|nr:hypothetical protein [Pyrinomonadaceae bacterium]